MPLEGYALTEPHIEPTDPYNENLDLDDTLNDLGDDEEFEDADPVASNDATIAALMENLQAMVKERDEAIDAALRANAELQNFRRRTLQEAERTRQLATEHLVVQLLPVLDNFERTLQALDSGATVESVMEGVKGIDRQLRSALESVNLRRIEALGTNFDPTIHEAWGTHEDESSDENTVTHELEAGYRMGDSVLRTAKVKVSTKP